jgi:hypothetical protein
MNCNTQIPEEPKTMLTQPGTDGVTLAALTADLCTVAGKALAQESAASLTVARAALMDIARLNGLIGGDGPPAVAGRVVVLADRPLSEDEWTTLHPTTE